VQRASGDPSLRAYSFGVRFSGGFDTGAGFAADPGLVLAGENWVQGFPRFHDYNFGASPLSNLWIRGSSGKTDTRWTFEPETTTFGFLTFFFFFFFFLLERRNIPALA